MIPRLLAITPPRGPVGTALVQAASLSGVEVALLLRDPGSSAAQTLEATARLTPLRRAAVAAGLPVYLSCGPDEVSRAPSLARDHGLQGVQVRGDPEPAVMLRAHAAWPDGVLGRSVHGAPPSTPPEADHYAVFAPVFAPNTRTATPKPAVGTEALARWCAHHPRVFALGGITPQTAAACVEAGAWGVAGISTFLGAAGPVADTLRALAAVLPRPRDVSTPPPRG